MNMLEMTIRLENIIETVDTDVKLVFSMIEKTNSLTLNSTLDDINANSIVYSLCKSKLLKTVELLKEARAISISINFMDAIKLIDNFEYTIYKIMPKIEESIRALSIFAQLV